MNTNNIGLPSLALAQQISDRFINLVDVRKDRFNILSFIVKLSFQSQCILTDDDLARMRLASLIQSKAIDSSPKQEIPQKKKRRKKKKRKYAITHIEKCIHKNQIRLNLRGTNLRNHVLIENMILDSVAGHLT